MQKIIIMVLIMLAFTRCGDHDEGRPQDIKTSRPRDRKTERPLDLETERPKDRETSRPRDRKTARPQDLKTERPQDRKRARPGDHESGVISKAEADSVRREKIQWLLKTKTEIDLNEPVSRDFLFNGINDLADHPFTIVSKEKFLRINFDNDILDNTDHFYTNGIRLELVSPGLKNLPFRYLMLPYFGYGINYYGIALTQNMYTPSTTKVGGVLDGDRPYAAWLCFSFYKISNDPAKAMRQTSEIFIGVIGPYSGGDFVQTTFHNSVPTNNEPLGWEYQVQNDIALNYKLTFEKGIFSRPTLDLNVNGTGELGTLYTNLSGGFSFRAGLLNPYFKRLWVSKKEVNEATGMRNAQVYFFMKVNGTAVGYDATLQGGMFNKTSVYTISADQISRFLFNGSTGVTLSLGGIRLDVEQFIISPEFRKGWWHKWVHIGLTFAL